jgi:hypothetical protein
MSTADLIEAIGKYEGMAPPLPEKYLQRLIALRGELSRREDEAQAETLRPGYPWGDT